MMRLLRIMFNALVASLRGVVRVVGAELLGSRLLVLVSAKPAPRRQLGGRPLYRRLRTRSHPPPHGSGFSGVRGCRGRFRSGGIRQRHVIVLSPLLGIGAMLSVDGLPVYSFGWPRARTALYVPKSVSIATPEPSNLLTGDGGDQRLRLFESLKIYRVANGGMRVFTEKSRDSPEGILQAPSNGLEALAARVCSERRDN